MNIAYRAKRYLLNLNFYPGQIEFGPDLSRKRLIWTMSVYALLAIGLVAQQAIDLTRHPLTIDWTNLSWNTLLASAVVALALLPPFMRWFNRKFPRPSYEHAIWTFSFGFFVNLSTNAMSKLVTKALFRV
jgi:hypothetical protein